MNQLKKKEEKAIKKGGWGRGWGGRSPWCGVGRAALLVGRRKRSSGRWDAAHHAALWVPFRLSKMPFAGGEGKEKGSSGCQRLGEGKQKGRSANGDFGAIGAVGAAGAGATRQCWDRNRQTRACSALCN